MNLDKNMTEIFDLPTCDIQRNTTIVDVNATRSNNSNKPSIAERVDVDYDTTRNNLYTLLQQGQDALECALEVAKSSEHPRAFEVVGNLMKQVADINAQLMDLHSKKKHIDTPNKGEEQQSKTVTNNAIFVGSTAELNKLITNMNKG